MWDEEISPLGMNILIRNSASLVPDQNIHHLWWDFLIPCKHGSILMMDSTILTPPWCRNQSPIVTHLHVCQAHISDSKLIQFCYKNTYNPSWVNPCGIRKSHTQGWILWRDMRFLYPTWILMMNSINIHTI